MPSSVVLTYVDPAVYARDIPGLAVELHPTAAGEFKAASTLISLSKLSVGRFADNLPRVMHAVPLPGRALLSFKTADGPELVWDGLPMQSTTIVQHTHRASYFQRSAGEASWSHISIAGGHRGVPHRARRMRSHSTSPHHHPDPNTHCDGKAEATSRRLLRLSGTGT